MISTPNTTAWVSLEMDKILAKAIIDLKVPRFGPNQKNKGDSPSCRFEPRHLLSSPDTLRYVGQRLADVVTTRCEGLAIVGMATSGIAWTALASSYSGMPMLYIRKALESGVSENLLEGIHPPEGPLVLVDDLIFDGNSKRLAISNLRELGYKVSDVVVIIDRQLQRVEDGPPIEKAFNLKLHALITMSEIVDYMLARQEITADQLNALVADYNRYERWTVPTFARIG